MRGGGTVRRVPQGSSAQAQGRDMFAVVEGDQGGLRHGSAPLLAVDCAVFDSHSGPGGSLVPILDGDLPRRKKGPRGERALNQHT